MAHKFCICVYGLSTHSLLRIYRFFDVGSVRLEIWGKKIFWVAPPQSKKFSEAPHSPGFGSIDQVVFTGLSGVCVPWHVSARERVRTHGHIRK